MFITVFINNHCWNFRNGLKGIKLLCFIIRTLDFSKLLFIEHCKCALSLKDKMLQKGNLTFHFQTKAASLYGEILED